MQARCRRPASASAAARLGGWAPRPLRLLSRGLSTTPPRVCGTCSLCLLSPAAAAHGGTSMLATALLARGCMLTGLAARHAASAMAVVQRAPLIEAPRVAGSGGARVLRWAAAAAQHRSGPAGASSTRGGRVRTGHASGPTMRPNRLGPSSLRRAACASARCRQHISGNRGADKPTGACSTAGRACSHAVMDELQSNTAAPSSGQCPCSQPLRPRFRISLQYAAARSTPRVLCTCVSTRRRSDGLAAKVGTEREGDARSSVRGRRGVPTPHSRLSVHPELQLPLVALLRISTTLPPPAHRFSLSAASAHAHRPRTCQPPRCQGPRAACLRPCPTCPARASTSSAARASRRTSPSSASCSILGAYLRRRRRRSLCRQQRR
jgi:hypothetical protein